MHGTVTFPGINSIQSGSYTLSHGISPGRAVLTIAPQRNVQAKEGTLTFKFGRRTVKIRNMRVQADSYVRNPNGWVTQVTLLDKRRKWGWGAISGQYNQRDRKSGELKPATVRSARQLAELCLKAMGEPDYDVTALGVVAGIEVDWDYDTPAVALSQICAEAGCRVALQTDGKVLIVKLGEGPNLRGKNLAADSETKIHQEKPSALIVVGAPVRYQADFVLEAVGLEPDGSVRLIDQLSYRPAAGWTQTPAEEFAADTDDKKKEAYKQSVYRMYRVKIDVLNKYGVLPHFGQITYLDQILPLPSTQIDTTVDPNGLIVAAPAEVWGVWYDQNELAANTDTELKIHADASKQSFYKRGFQIDNERGIVVFSQPVYKQNGTGAAATVAPAELALRVAVNLRFWQNRALVRWTYRQKLGGKGPARYLHHNELALAITGNFTSVDPPRINGTFDNVGSLKPLGDKILLRELKILEKQERSESATYGGIVPTELTGYIQAVTWSVGASQFTTTEVNANFDPGSIPEVDLGFIAAQRNSGVAYQELDKARAVATKIGDVVGAP